MIDDSPSRCPNLPGFVATRHDQGLFSVLYKLGGMPALPGSETHAEDWGTLADYPILDMRDCGDHRNDLQRLRKWRFLARVAPGPLSRKYEKKK